MNMYALRGSRFINRAHSSKPDGMFIRKDGRMTDHKQNALLFETEEQAFNYALSWKQTAQHNGPLFIVECSVKPILHTVSRVKCSL